MAYIKVPSVFEKLEKADKSFRPAILLTNAGWGKTAAVRYYYRNRASLWLSGLSGRLNAMPDPQTIRQGVVVIDDISWLNDTASEDYVLNLLRRSERQIVLIGRGNFPGWLSQIAFELDFVHISHRDLILTEPLITKFFEAAGITISEADARLVFQVLFGYPPAIKMCLARCERGEKIGRPLFAEVRIDLFHFYEKAFFELWKEPVQELLLSICRYPDFSPEMAGVLSGREDVPELLEYCRRIGSFMMRKAPDQYALSEDLLNFLRWKQDILWPVARIEDNYRRAAYYYRRKDRILDALRCYEKAGAVDLIQQTLIEHAEKHPGFRQYYELRPYYEELPRSMILESPVLMACMSMLCSLTMQVEQSEQWYRELLNYEAQAQHPLELRREAKTRLAYLDISLPHRAGKGLIGILRRVYSLHINDHISLPELFVTGNYPSLMNGSLDFCDWARNGEQIAHFMSKPVETLMGPSGKGLINIALAEYGFERSTMQPYEVITRLSNGYAAADQDGKIETCFAAQGVMIRQHLAQGQYPTAARLLDAMRDKVEKAGAEHLKPNLEALSVWLSLYMGPSEAQEEHLQKLPDVYNDFYIPRRFRYEVAIRCLIAREQYAEAMSMAAYMTRYYEEYKRTYLWIENELFKAIILYRQQSDEWQSVLEGALLLAQQFRLTRVVSMEGSAVLPLLTALQSRKVSPAFIKLLTSEAREMALHFPEYLKYTPREGVVLTAREQEILGLLLAGKTTEEICQACGITYSGLKKHNRSIYAKLGVKTRAEAERMAYRLGMARRKDVKP